MMGGRWGRDEWWLRNWLEIVRQRDRKWRRAFHGVLLCGFCGGDDGFSSGRE